ncbi:hypothetical protein V8G54_020829 [Vigna mungo]|uniref:Uncharacterized protein n=1 Tax=Vigna mungo TaxID=3915 RepID=A0AAQ3NF03_VIGMU
MERVFGPDPFLKVFASVHISHSSILPSASHHYSPVSIFAPPSRCRVPKRTTVHRVFGDHKRVRIVGFYPFPEVRILEVFWYSVTLDLSLFLVCDSSVLDYGSNTWDYCRRARPAPVFVERLGWVQRVFNSFPVYQILRY